MVLQTIKEYYHNNKNYLLENYPGLNEKRLIEEFGSDSKELLQEHLTKLSVGIPLEYITGKSYFYNSEFLVNQHTLIPRYETEGLIEMAKKIVKKDDYLLDIGTGSGNIILSLIQELPFPVKANAVDISDECLKVARMNAYRLRYKYHPETAVTFKNQDRLSGDHNQYNLIISNPPYIKREADHELVHHQVLKFEPHLALFLDDDQYEPWFSEFFQQIECHLTKEGTFLMEGHESHLKEQCEMASPLFKSCEIKKDLSGRDRYLMARKG